MDLSSSSPLSTNHLALSHFDDCNRQNESIPNDILVSEKTDCGAVHCTYAHTLSDSDEDVVIDDLDNCDQKDSLDSITISPPNVSLTEICQKLAARLSNVDSSGSMYTDAYEDEIVKESPLNSGIGMKLEDRMILPKADVVLHSDKESPAKQKKKQMKTKSTVTRSGRKIIPPLDYWRGERIREVCGEVRVSVGSKPSAQIHFINYSKKNGNGNSTPTESDFPNKQRRTAKRRSSQTTWSKDRLNLLYSCAADVCPSTARYWQKVAKRVGNCTADECRKLYQDKFSRENYKKSNKAASKLTNLKKGRKGVRRILNEQAKDHEDDLFESSPYRNSKSLKLQLSDSLDETDGDEKCIKNQKNESSDIEKSNSLNDSLCLLEPVNRDKIDTYIHKIKHGRKGRRRKILPLKKKLTYPKKISKARDIKYVFDQPSSSNSDIEEDSYFDDDDE
ncbi:uncharacterized protein TRIADDRAFT_57331 [Trichoplax adhaerens]|uniref:Myb-like domain-containing protein n=1 Tax=Trichoplax adhaerens TaxID=10228 RepID=B3RZ53_TRIAD|nr:predicted protein [Trichoplax adhaerens]EDV23783.1 predicted protein [Trichoplax adhaerens]|eukprot:XP_002113309.1 predicted protein [Trichoplax adhaerens]